MRYILSTIGGMLVGVIILAIVVVIGQVLLILLDTFTTAFHLSPAITIMILLAAGIGGLVGFLAELELGE